MQILVIGSKGFIGSRLLNYYRSRKDCVAFGADVVVDYEDEKYFLIDALNSNFDNALENQEFSVCINCSGAASVPDSLKNPQRDFYLNTLNVFNLLNGIRKHQPNCKFLNLSSAAVYGNPLSLPINEAADCNPLSPYGFHKRNAEIICEEFTRFYNIKTCNLRIFSAYGNGLRKQIFWDITQKAKNQKKLTLFGTGNESRDFIHIKDIIQAIDLVVNLGAFNSDSYNVANGVEITIKEAAELLLHALEWHGELSFTNQNRHGDPMNWCADITKLTKLGYKQSINIRDGLIKYSKWLKEPE